MKAWRFYGFGDLRLDELPMPRAKPGWVVLKTRVVQLSVTEAMLAKGARSMGYAAVEKRLAEEAPIQLFGHEFCATIVEVGEGVQGFAVGDRVTARNMVPCLKCMPCLSGHTDMCQSIRIIGSQLPALLGEYGTVPAEVLTKVPDAVSDNEAACVQPLSEAVEAAGSARIGLGDTCVVLGAGAMGLGCIQAAKVSGAGMVIATDVREQVLNLARKLGADEVIDVRVTDPVAAIKEMTGGIGPDVVFETAGGPKEQGLAGFDALHQGIEMVRVKGKIVQVSHLGTKTELSFDRCRIKSVQVIFPEASSRKLMEHTLRLLATGGLTVKPMLTHVLKGLDKVPEAIDITANKGRYGAINPAQVVVTLP